MRSYTAILYRSRHTAQFQDTLPNFQVMLALRGRVFSYSLGWGSPEQDCNRNWHKAGNPDVISSTIPLSHPSSFLLSFPMQIQEQGCISTASLTHPHIVLREQDVRKLTVIWIILFSTCFFVLCCVFVFLRWKDYFKKISYGLLTSSAAIYCISLGEFWSLICTH